MDGEVFVILFYDPSCCQAPNTKINDEIKKELQRLVLNSTNGKNYIYYEINSSETTMQPLLDMVQLDPFQLKHGPTILIACSGMGYWAFGKDAP